MTDEQERTYTVFAGLRRIGAGDVIDAARGAKAYFDGGGREALLIFNDQTGAQVELDLQGSLEDVLERVTSDPEHAPPRPKVGRPKLGVASREVSLLPRHWEWLEQQRGGVSGALRKLVEEASRARRGKDLADRARDATAKLMWGLAGDLAHFEEASRALYAKDHARFLSLIASWPNDVRAYVTVLANEADRLQRLADEQERAAS
jgi:hypothetical protein